MDGGCEDGCVDGGGVSCVDCGGEDVSEDSGGKAVWIVWTRMVWVGIVGIDGGDKDSCVDSGRRDDTGLFSLFVPRFLISS